MKETGHAAPAVTDDERLLADLQSPDERVRARAVHSVCPCHAGWRLFEKHMALIARLKKDRSPVVRGLALHVFQDAAEMQSSGLPTNPREATNELLRTRRRSRFRPDEGGRRGDATVRAESRKSRRRFKD